MPNISMKSLLEAGVHFGHQTRRWNPKMSRYIYGSRNNIHIIDLQKTVKELKKALRFIRDMAAEGKEVFFVGTKRQAKDAISQESQRCESPYIHERWLGGTLTNFNTVRRSANRLVELERMKESGIFQVLSKKEASRLDKERIRLMKSLDGIRKMEKLPGCMFVVDPVQEATAIKEARKIKIPIVAICDTNCNPDEIDYPIPGNDDAIRAVKLFCMMIADAILDGKQMAQKKYEAEVANIPEETSQESTPSSVDSSEQNSASQNEKSPDIGSSEKNQESPSNHSDQVPSEVQEPKSEKSDSNVKKDEPALRETT